VSSFAWPPAATTTNWRPSASKLIGVACAPAGRRISQRFSPVAVSNARRKLSVVAPMKTSPPAVASGPPMFGAPSSDQNGQGALSRDVPSGLSHAIFPCARSTATSLPHGGAVHGTPSGESSSLRRIA